MNIVPWKSKENWLDPFDSIEKEFGNYFNFPILKAEAKNRLAGIWNPAVDIFDEKDRIRIKADIPGLEKDQIDITAEGGVLTIRGEKKEEKEIKETGCVRSERYYGSFHRSFTLPSGVDTQKIDATYKNGVLELSLPKKEEAKSNQVKVQIK